MRAAIYARRSTEEHQAASLETQTDEARRFCAARGWTLDDRHVYTDSGVSRSEFVNRPALVAMLLAAERRELDVVVTRDESRLGGDMNRVALLIQDLVESGVELWCYYTGQRVEADSITARLLIVVRSFADELEREKIAGRTREHLERKARAGHVVGGKAYGYSNVPVMEGERRVRVEYAINPAEADVVREVFRRYLAGEGLRTIAMDLNARGVPSPHAGRRGTGSWGPTTLYDLLRRERYRGVLVWGWRGSVYRKGTRVEIRRPEAEWTRAERPDLAIVDAATWDAVHARLRTAGRGRSAPDRRARSLLAGLAKCGACGGPIHLNRCRFGSHVQAVYQCGWAHDRGAAVCAMRIRRPAAEIDAALVGWVRANVLRPEVIDRVLDRTRALVEAEANGSDDGDGARLTRELVKVATEIERITTAIATTDAPPEALAAALVEREKRAAALRRELDALRARQAIPAPQWNDLARAARARVEELSAMLARGAGEGRAALAALLRGPLAVTPVAVDRGHRFHLAGEVVVPGFEPLVTGGIGASPTGFVAYPCDTSAVLVVALTCRRAA